ncbi:lysophospholipid acyltransferase family protein [Candidatus Venteria ishoeyi]|uniref:lysophospholipid acyltransferase family protein n=1 Tax=Candidatus Venteria ishoeyi TaxID=1899563 RepID=UPI0025A54907|nr:lysophospholipid acyltransferase family protein [Candidatus Venteria ishoeyi]MDM8548163.1 lysophospholipid acyltransferase family protein [Candidatus Venteria ishoeyi]
MAHKIQWGNFWLNTIDGLVRLYCRYYHRLSPLSKLSLPTQGSALLVANHISGLDPLLMVCASSRPLRFLIAREEYEKPLLKWLYHAMGCIPVDRSSRPEIALRAALRALEAGEVIALFPQGRIILPNAQQKPLKRGVIWLAKQTQTPIYAMHIQGVVGMGKIMPALFQRSHVQLQVHEAMRCTQADCLESLQKKIMGQIYE